MTAYVTIASGDLDAESPIDTDLMTALARNPDAIAEGDSSVPDASRVAGKAQKAATTGSYVEASATVDLGSLSGTYTKKAVIMCPRAGTFNVRLLLSIDAGAGVNIFGKIYVNGVAVGTERTCSSGGGGSATTSNDENITVVAGDTIELWAKDDGTTTSGSGTLKVASANPFVPCPHLDYS